jgi:MoaA/NifB/PqqE/SkfB family radical SAM enzyme
MFHFPEKLASLPAGQTLLPPLHIRLKPTNRCNHNCRYCAYRQPHLQLGQNMRINDEIPREKILEIARDLVEMGVKAVTYSGGGEPLIYPHLLEVSRLLADGGVKLACLTNGAKLQGELAEFFAHRATWLRVSMDGWDDESYHRYRGVKDGEFTKIITNMAQFAKLDGPCLLGVSYIVDAGNWPHIPEMLTRLKDIGVRSVKVSACVVDNEAARNNAYHAPHFAATQELLQKTIADLTNDSFEILDAWHTLDGKFEKNYHWCPFSQLLTIIGADQAVYPCQDKAYNNGAILGDLREQSFKEFIKNNKAAFFRLNPTLDCRHHCCVNSHNLLSLEYLGLDPYHGGFV